MHVPAIYINIEKKIVKDAFLRNRKPGPCHARGPGAAIVSYPFKIKEFDTTPLLDALIRAGAMPPHSDDKKSTASLSPPEKDALIHCLKREYYGGFTNTSLGGASQKGSYINALLEPTCSSTDQNLMVSGVGFTGKDVAHKANCVFCHDPIEGDPSGPAIHFSDKNLFKVDNQFFMQKTGKSILRLTTEKTLPQADDRMPEGRPALSPTEQALHSDPNACSFLT